MIKKINQKNKKQTIQAAIAIIFMGLSFIFDKIVIRIINIIQYPLLFKLFYTITLLGESYIFVWIALFLMVALMIYRKPIITFILTIGAAAVIDWVIKYIINRPRPFEAANINNLVLTKWSSFPSGHAMLFFSMIPMISRNFPKIKIIAWIIAILVGFSRIYLGVHYFSDVLCGAVIGYFIGWIFLRIGEKNAWKY